MKFQVKQLDVIKTPNFYKNMVKRVKINTEEIKDWNSFHKVFSNAFNFPTYYGRNMNAWIDCMDEFTNELTVIDMGDCRELKVTKPNIIEAINECAAFVNYRRIETGETPVLLVAMFT